MCVKSVLCGWRLGKVVTLTSSPQIGVDFALKVLNWDANSTIRLQLWDIAGGRGWMDGLGLCGWTWNLAYMMHVILTESQLWAIP